MSVRATKKLTQHRLIYLYCCISIVYLYLFYFYMHVMWRTHLIGFSDAYYVTSYIFEDIMFS